MSSTFPHCWDLFLSLPPDRRKTHFLRSTSPLYSHLYCHCQCFYQILPWVRTWRGRWERETECSHLTTKIRSWLWAIWARPVRELTASWILSGIPARALLRHPCGRPGTWVYELRPNWPLILSSPLNTGGASSWHATTPPGPSMIPERPSLICVVHIGLQEIHMCSWPQQMEYRSAPLSFAVPLSWPSFAPLDFWVWGGGVGL